MRKLSLYGILAGLVCSGLVSCKRSNGINNNTVVEKPYALYFADTAGALYVTNDGTTFQSVFKADGSPSRAICVSENNILFAKNSLYVSTNNGDNFNLTFDSLTNIDKRTCLGIKYNLNQSMIIDLPDWNRVYTTSGRAHAVTANYLGVQYSNNHGVPMSWATDGSYDTTGRTGLLPVKMLSYTRLKNGLLAGLAVSNFVDPVLGFSDTFHFRNFYKTCGDDNCPWKETTGSGQNGGNDTSGIALPPNRTVFDTGYYSLGHYNDRLIAIDQTCHNGAYYSDDTGRIWKKYSGLPAGIPLLCIASPFEQVCLIGTQGAGLYILNVNTQSWQPNNNGLGSSLIVRSIAAKENIYKNKSSKRYIYLATDKGIFQSSDDGINWVRTIPGNFVAVY